MNPDHPADAPATKKVYLYRNANLSEDGSSTCYDREEWRFSPKQQCDKVESGRRIIKRLLAIYTIAVPHDTRFALGFPRDERRVEWPGGPCSWDAAGLVRLAKNAVAGSEVRIVREMSHQETAHA